MRLFGPFVLSLLATFLPAQAQPLAEPTVRVQVLDQVPLSQPTLEAIGAEGTLRVDGQPVRTTRAGERVQLSRYGSEVRVEVAGEQRTGREVTFEAPEIRIRSGQTDRRYPARLSVRVDDGALRVVNHAPMETYVASVVASELNFPEVEAAKAQAVLARTYAARRRGRTASYDLVDDQRSQVYQGLATITPTSRRAALETAGETLTYNGELADAYYFSSSGGHTADNESIWSGAPVPYLRGVPDPLDSVAPDHSWRTTADRRSVLSALSSQYGGSVQSIRVERRSPKGRVLTVRLDGASRETITGSQFRRAVNAAVGARTVRSTRYSIDLEGDQYVFTGGGYGHGVGMSQFGAVGQARAGRSYREILAHYFLGTDVSGSTAAGAPWVAGAAIPREPGRVSGSPSSSALRTRYRAPSARRWPTPRRLVHEATDDAPAVVGSETATSEPLPSATRPTRRRTAW